MVLCQRKVWNMRVLRLLVRGIFLVENLITLYKFEFAKLENGNQRAVRLFPWRFQKDEEQRWKASMFTAYWPGAHWDTHTKVTDEAKPQVWGETPWKTDSPGLTVTPLSQTMPASSATPMPLRLQRAWRHTSSRASSSGERSKMATRRGTAPWRSSSSCSLAEGNRGTENNCFRVKYVIRINRTEATRDGNKWGWSKVHKLYN